MLIVFVGSQQDAYYNKLRSRQRARVIEIKAPMHKFSDIENRGKRQSGQLSGKTSAWTLNSTSLLVPE